MKYYLDISLSILILMIVSPLLVGITAIGAFVSGNPFIFGKPVATVNNQPNISVQQDKTSFEQIA